jgi:hypothetical protein
MRRIGLAVVLTVSFALAPLAAAPRPAFLSATAWASLRHQPPRAGRVLLRQR